MRRLLIVVLLVLFFPTVSFGADNNGLSGKEVTSSKIIDSDKVPKYYGEPFPEPPANSTFAKMKAGNYKPNFPEQNEFNYKGYLIILGIFLLFLISDFIGELKIEEEFRSGWSFKIVASIIGVMFLLIIWEDTQHVTEYFPIFGYYIPLFELLFIIGFVFGLYAFMITVVWSIIKFKVSGGLPPFAYRMIKLADMIRTHAKI